MVSTRTASYSQNSSMTPITSAAVPNTLNDRRRRWSHLLRSQHYQPIISEVLDEELPKYENSGVINNTDRITLLRECALILASAPSVFAAAVDGNLVRRLLTDSDLQAEYEGIQARAHDQPSIYIHILTDNDGNAPTPNQYLIIRDMVMDYITPGSSSKHASQIDNISLPQVTEQASRQGYRKYLHTSKRSSKRVETLQRFCQGVQNRWLETRASLRDAPFEHPPGECGYSRDTHTRLAQHRNRKSSNYVMNLVEDICAYLHRTGTFVQHFWMHQCIIYLIFRPTQAAIAEIFCSGLLQVWVENGGGFNAYPAGRSVESARRLSMDEWDAHELWVRQTSPIEENMRTQQRVADEWRRALEWEVVVDKSDMAEYEDSYDCV